MKQKLVRFFVILLFIVGVGFLAYPTISNEWNNYVQSTVIREYEDSLSQMTEEDYSAYWDAARAFNANITENAIGTDAFGAAADGNAVKPTEEFLNSEYFSVLNINGDGVMGYLSIPKIKVKLSIMHGTFDEYIQTAVGHMNGTALPIGGESTHSVIVGHRGLPSAELFTNIDQLQVGDKFYIHVLDETLAYQVDEIHDAIPAEDINSLAEAMKVEPGKDYVTLFTCTPYGVNTHRLLVRAKRVDYSEETKLIVPADATRYGSLIVAPFIGAPILLIAFILYLIFTSKWFRNRKRK